MGKIVLFSNIKGGVGKTTLCALFATYLTENEKKVGVIDADLQQSLYRHREREEMVNPDIEDFPWEIISIYDIKEGQIEDVLKKLKKNYDYILIDCPGNLQDNNLLPLFKNTDHIVTPIAYDEDTLDALDFFVNTLKEITSKKIIILPNRINLADAKIENTNEWENYRKKLKKVGEITPRINDRQSVKNYSTIDELTIYQTRAVQHAFDYIKKYIENK